MWAVEVIAPPVVGPVLVGVVAGQGILVRVLALVQLLLPQQVVGHHRRHDSGNVDVGQAGGEVVQIHVQAVAGVWATTANNLSLYSVVARPASIKKANHK